MRLNDANGDRRWFEICDYPLSKLIWFNEDGVVGFLQLLSEHAKHIWSGAEVGQVVYDQFQKQLKK